MNLYSKVRVVFLWALVLCSLNSFKCDDILQRDQLTVDQKKLDSTLENFPAAPSPSDQPSSKSFIDSKISHENSPEGWMSVGHADTSRSKSEHKIDHNTGDSSDLEKHEITFSTSNAAHRNSSGFATTKINNLHPQLKPTPRAVLYRTKRAKTKSQSSNSASPPTVRYSPTANPNSGRRDTKKKGQSGRKKFPPGWRLTRVTGAADRAESDDDIDGDEVPDSFIFEPMSQERLDYLQSYRGDREIKPEEHIDADIDHSDEIKDKDTNPMKDLFRDSQKRLTLVRAVITPDSIRNREKGGRSEAGKKSLEAAMGGKLESGDVAGHIIAHSLGGSNSDVENNFFIQHAQMNNGEWKSAEGKVRRFIEGEINRKGEKDPDSAEDADGDNDRRECKEDKTKRIAEMTMRFHYEDTNKGDRNDGPIRRPAGFHVQILLIERDAKGKEIGCETMILSVPNPPPTVETESQNGHA